MENKAIQPAKTAVYVSAIVRPLSITDQVTKLIKEQISKGVLRPGERVVELKIAKQLGVGQNAIREALIKLHELGYVQRVPRKGTYITELTRADAEVIHRIRLGTETVALELILERFENKELDLSQAEHLLVGMSQAAERDDSAAFYDNDLQFHRSLWHLADNQYLFQTLDKLVTPLFAFLTIKESGLPGAGAWYREAIPAHERMLAALKSRSAEGVRNLLYPSHKPVFQQYAVVFGNTSRQPNPRQSSRAERITRGKY